MSLRPPDQATSPRPPDHATDGPTTPSRPYCRTTPRRPYCRTTPRRPDAGPCHVAPMPDLATSPRPPDLATSPPDSTRLPPRPAWRPNHLDRARSWATTYAKPLMAASSCVTAAGEEGEGEGEAAGCWVPYGPRHALCRLPPPIPSLRPLAQVRTSDRCLMYSRDGGRRPHSVRGRKAEGPLVLDSSPRASPMPQRCCCFGGGHTRWSSRPRLVARMRKRPPSPPAVDVDNFFLIF
jgi:hypothetical protein